MPPRGPVGRADRTGGAIGAQDVLVRVYRTDPKNAEMCERLVDLDEGVQEWRYRHVKMVERTIGGQPGTAARQVRPTCAAITAAFPDLWAIRAQL
ncbi:MAG: tryptophan 2,3-dioxygenase family protein [Vicinamibacterales bacterium]